MVTHSVVPGAPRGATAGVRHSVLYAKFRGVVYHTPRPIVDEMPEHFQRLMCAPGYVPGETDLYGDAENPGNPMNKIRVEGHHFAALLAWLHTGNRAWLLGAEPNKDYWHRFGSVLGARDLMEANWDNPGVRRDAGAAPARSIERFLDTVREHAVLAYRHAKVHFWPTVLAWWTFFMGWLHGSLLPLLRFWWDVATANVVTSIIVICTLLAVVPLLTPSFMSAAHTPVVWLMTPLVNVATGLHVGALTSIADTLEAQTADICAKRMLMDTLTEEEKQQYTCKAFHAAILKALRDVDFLARLLHVSGMALDLMGSVLSATLDIVRIYIRIAMSIFKDRLDAGDFSSSTPAWESRIHATLDVVAEGMAQITLTLVDMPNNCTTLCS